MNFTEAVLVVIVIVLTVFIVLKYKAKESDTGESFSMDPKTVKRMQLYKTSSPEVAATREQAEYFVGSSTADRETMTDTNDFEYAKNDFGSDGGDYKNFIMNEAVDPAMIKNHAEFVKDRIKSPYNITGATFSPTKRQEIAESSQSIPWLGLRRPEALPGGTASLASRQIPDVDNAEFSKGPTFIWKSS